LVVALAFVLVANSHAAFAADVVEEQQLDEMTIKGDITEKSAVPANLPSTTEGVTAKQIAETINAVTSGETLNYLPSIHVRERYIGDRNGVLVMRVNSSIASAQTTVYADDLLLSNFLNNSFSTAPRWGMVSPEEIDRVDVMYGPFSALYPGNSAGGVVLMTTHMPEKFEAHAKLDVFGERFKLYGTDKDYNGTHESASVGNKYGNWSLWVSGDHLDNHGHPMTFGNATLKTGAAPAAGTFTPVSGELHDIDTSGNPRIITSALGIDHTMQDNGKIKLGYDFSPTVRATYTLGIWQNQSDGSVDPYLKDAAGNPVYSTGGTGAYKYVQIGNNYYTVSSANPSQSESEHWMHGLSLKSDTGGVWDWEVVATLFNENKDISRTAANIGIDSGLGSTRPGGQVTFGDGTGWKNLDLRGEWRPGGDLKSEHQVSFGYHYDRYELDSVTYGTTASPITDWLTSDTGTLSTNSYGKTETQALYLQDAWQFAPAWKLIVGGRQEHWKAFDGSNYNAANVAPNPLNLVYADRSQSDFSPKLSLSYQTPTAWILRGSLGKGVRYPTVAEMFQTFNGPGGIKMNDPNLKPEQVNSGELVAERVLETGLLRTSFFWEDKRDALISQTDTTVTPNLTSIQNVDKIRTYGVEMAMDLSDLWIHGFDINGSVTYADSTIVEDTRNPGLEGTDQPRIPHWRATLVGLYRASDRLSYSLSYRYSGHQHNQLYNTTTHQYNDVNPDVYGAVSHYSVFDGKVNYKVAKQWTASLGINNIGNFKYYVNPNPYPQRTYFASMKFDY
jgi:iron complex outermembrane receptor protein